jgi:outer membrane murein-binding lipoprotein Lpp
MYNMDISIFGYKISLEIIILIAVLYLITVGHAYCSCCNFYSLIEGMDGQYSSMIQDPSAVVQQAQANVQQAQANVQAKVQQAQANQQLATQTTSGTPTTSTTTSTTTPTTESFGSKREGFTGANINYGESASYSLGNDNPIDTSSWSAQDMTVTPGQPLSAGVKAFLARPQQPVPLPEGEMLMFANTEFKPEYCPSSFSTSTGCAALTGPQVNYLVTRGGNNVPYSEY